MVSHGKSEILPNGKLSFEHLSGTWDKQTFASGKAAKEYAMGRRLLLLRKFEVLAEPYFGTIDAKECGDNLQSTFLEHSEDQLRTVVQVPVKGSEHLIHDCLKANNTDWAHIEFVVCGNDFYDMRLYSPLNEKRIDYVPLFTCGPR